MDNRIADPPLTRERLEEKCLSILDAYKSGKMVIEPDYFNHLTPCCDRVYVTTGGCSDKCPYECGKPFVQTKYCPTCEILSKQMNGEFSNGL